MPSQSPDWHVALLADQDRRYTIFNTEELVVLALGSLPGRWMRKKDIGRWILKHIKHYQTAAADAFFCETSTTSAMLNTLHHTMVTYLITYDTPIHRQLNTHKEPVYSITSGAAYSVLEHHINPTGVDVVVKQSTQSFPFCNLPPELRKEVYKMALAANGHRLSINATCFVAYDDEVPVWDASAPHDMLAMPSPNKMLALLSVSKGVYGEAMPEFYKSNHFYFDSMLRFKSFAIGIGPERRKYLSNITLAYTNLTIAAATTKLLLESELLKRLTLLIDINVDPADNKLMVFPSKRKFVKVEAIPGIKNLQQIRGLRKLEFDPFLRHTFVGDFLRPYVFQPVGTPGPATGSRKRASNKRGRPCSQTSTSTSTSTSQGDNTEDEDSIVTKKTRRT